MNIKESYGAITAILFTSGDAVALGDIAAAIDHSESDTLKLIRNLSDRLKAEASGILIMEINGSFQMCTNPDYFQYIERSAINSLPQTKALTLPLLETLAIIAYKQPVCKTDIEKIRGVDATHTVNKLMEYELVRELGRAQTPGRPILFGTTDKFLAHFGLSGLEQLPGTAGDAIFGAPL